MQAVIEKLQLWIQGALATLICNFLETIFSDVNSQVGDISANVSMTPSSWNAGVFDMMVNVCNIAIIPIANLILGCVFCYEIINAILDSNSLHDTDVVEVVYKSLIKLAIMIGIVTNVYKITMGIFEMGAWTVAQSTGAITGDATIDVGISIETIRDELMSLPPTRQSFGYLIKLCITSFIVSWAMKAISIVISVVVMGRMIEIYIYCCMGPIPFATMLNKELGSMGQNYIKSIIALALQGLMMMICVGIYAMLAHGLSVDGADLEKGLVNILVVSVVLCFTLIKTGSVSKAILNAH